MEFPTQGDWPAAIYTPREDGRHFVLPLLDPTGRDFSKLPVLPDAFAVGCYLEGQTLPTYEIGTDGSISTLFSNNPRATKRLLAIHSHLVQQRGFVSPSWGMLISYSLMNAFGLSQIDITPRARILASIADWRGGMSPLDESRWHKEVQERTKRAKDSYERFGSWYGIPTGLHRERQVKCSWQTVEVRGENEYGTVVVADGITDCGCRIRWQTGDTCKLDPGESGEYTFTVKAHVYDRDTHQRITLVSRVEKH